MCKYKTFFGAYKLNRRKNGSNIEYNPKFLSKIKKALEFQCLIVIFISTGSSNLDDRFSH